MRPVVRSNFRPQLGFSACLRAAAIALLFASGCGQSEGERCQVNSDCASGLTCEDRREGNGICKSSHGTTVTDAAVDASVPESDVQASVDAEPVSVSDATSALDTATVDAMSVDTGAID
jgi:hypothetical protein